MHFLIIICAETCIVACARVNDWYQHDGSHASRPISLGRSVAEWISVDPVPRMQSKQRSCCAFLAISPLCEKQDSSCHF